MKILGILTASKKTVEKNKANRKAKALKRNQESLIDKLEEERDSILEKKEELLSVTMETVNEKTWNQEFQDVLLAEEVIDKKISVANATLKEYFNEK